MGGQALFSYHERGTKCAGKSTEARRILTGKRGETCMDNVPNVLMSYLRVTQHMSQQFRAHFGKLNLTFPQALVLNVLGEEGPIPISVLAERTGSANSTVSGIVDRLEKLGLAKRERSEQDRRVIYVAATEQYYELRKKAETDVSGYFNTLLGEMPPEDKRQVAEAFRKLDAALTARMNRKKPESGSYEVKE